MSDIPYFSSKRKDCLHYQHSRNVPVFCCGGKKVKEIVEMILCRGLEKNCRSCSGCAGYSQKNEEAET